MNMTRQIWQWCSEQAAQERLISLQRCADALGIAKTPVFYHVGKLVVMGYMARDVTPGQQTVYRVVLPLYDCGQQEAA